MKELSIEEKAKAYDKALEKAKYALTTDMDDSGHWAVKYIFPELKESEDEKNIKDLIDELKCSLRAANCQNDTCRGGHEKRIALLEWAIAWLENQGDNTYFWKPTKEQINALEHFVRSIGESGYASPYDENTKLLKSLINDLYKLEKQGEQTPVINMITPEESLGIDSDTYNEIVDECIYGEQKPIIDGILTATNYDKMFQNCNVHKFKVGDWIVGANSVYKVVSLNDELSCYIVNTVNNEEIKIPYYFDCVPNHLCSYHLWTIDDAKDGDVLSYVTDEEDLWIMIYWSLYAPYEGHVHYHALLVNDNFYDKGTCCICINDLKPATKEQRDLLFSKMKEAGYVWDDEKKELMKIEK